MKALIHKLRLLALRGLLTQAPLEGAIGIALRSVQRQLPELLKQSPREVVDIIGRPEILTHLLVLRAGLQSPEACFAGCLPHLIAALRANPALLWDAPVAQLLTDSRVYVFSPPCRAMISDLSGVELEHPDGTRRALASETAQARAWPLEGGIELAAIDTNPLRMNEAHPDKSGNALSLGGKSPEEWQTRLNEALGLIRDTLPTFAAALPHALQRIVPVGFEPEMHFSASYREAPGTIYMTLHPSPLTLAEAIVHEVQHGKLNTLSWFDAVLHNAMTEWSPSPVRPDLRPIWGVLLAVHAFVPVAHLHQRLVERDHPIAKTPQFERRRLEVLQGNENGLKLVVAKGQPTATGQKVIDGLDVLHQACMAKNKGLTSQFQSSALPPG